MQPLFYKIAHEGRDAFHVSVRADPLFEFNWHYHPEIELTLIVDSVGQRLVGNGIADYAAGDLVLLGPNLPHSWRSMGGPAVHRAVVVQFHRNFLGESFFQLEEMAPIAQLLDRSANGLAFGHTEIGQRAAAQFAEMHSLAPPDRLITLLSVLRLLSQESDAQTLSLGSVQPNYRMEYQQRLNAVCAYLEGQAPEEIDYAAAARLAHMNQASLCRLFRRATGRTMGTYVNELRVADATRLLVETDLSVIEIGCQVGFFNSSNFNRQFKRMKGVTPGALRKAFRAESRK